jgi:hypothetical protein
MIAIDAHEPTADQLVRARGAFEVSLLSFSRSLEKLDQSDFLPRYHRLALRIRCREAIDTRPLYLTVRRSGSKIAAENFYTVPFFADHLSEGSEADYDLLSFDSFNLPFESISVELCTSEDYLKRRVSPEHIERAKRFATRKGANQPPQTTRTSGPRV